MAFQAKVKVNISGLRAYRLMVQGGPVAGALAQVGITRIATAAVRGPLGLMTLPWAAVRGATLPGRILAMWEARYRGFLIDRFDRFSKGMGDWAPLAQSTERRRRKGKGKATGNNAILRDTGTLFAALNPNIANTNAGGWLHEITHLGTSWRIEVGFGGPQQHPGGRATIADIASFHQNGGPNLPQRKIIVPPPPEVVAAMREDARQVLTSVFIWAMASAAKRRVKQWAVRTLWRDTSTRVF